MIPEGRIKNAEWQGAEIFPSDGLTRSDHVKTDLVPIESI